jgi:hypothetical protein
MHPFGIVIFYYQIAQNSDIKALSNEDRVLALQ